MLGQHESISLAHRFFIGTWRGFFCFVFHTQGLEGLENATTGVLDFMWIDELYIVVPLPNPGQRRTNERLNFDMQHCLERHLANARRCKRCRNRRTPPRKLQLVHLLSSSRLILLTPSGAIFVRVAIPLTHLIEV